MLDAPNIQWPSGVAYLVGDRGTEALGVKDISSAVPETIVDTENFETGPPPGIGTWVLDPINPHSGLFCFRSAPILGGQNTQWSYPVPLPATFLRFWWRVSSEAGFDFFEIYKDSVSVPNRIFQQSGTLNTWAQATLNIAGATNIIFRYVKDGSVSAGLDLAAIDDLEWIVPGSPAVQNFEPFHLNTNNEVKVKDDGLDSIGIEQLIQTGLLLDVNSSLDAIEFDIETIRALQNGEGVKFASINTLVLLNTIVPAVIGKKIRVLSYVVTTKDEVQATWRSNVLNITGPLQLKLSTLSVVGSTNSPLFETAVGAALILSLDVIKQVSGHLTYIEI